MLINLNKDKNETTIEEKKIQSTFEDKHEINYKIKLVNEINELKKLNFKVILIDEKSKKIK